MTDINVIKADLTYLDQVSELFNLYRQFYEQESDLAAAKQFIKQRLTNDESTILIALSHAGKAIGFTQLYPAFSSVAMTPMLYLNDLFVDASSRKLGVGKALLKAANDYAKSVGAGQLKLATAIDNHKAKALYESNGYSKVDAFDHYIQKVDLPA